MEKEKNEKLEVKDLFQHEVDKLSKPMDGVDRECLLTIIEALLKTIILNRMTMDLVTGGKYSQEESNIRNFGNSLNLRYWQNPVAKILENLKERHSSMMYTQEATEGIISESENTTN